MSKKNPNTGRSHAGVMILIMLGFVLALGAWLSVSRELVTPWLLRLLCLLRKMKLPTKSAWAATHNRV